MPWKVMDVMDQKIRFVARGVVPGVNLSAFLCREFGISRPTGYYWLRRYREVGSVTGLQEGSGGHTGVRSERLRGWKHEWWS